MSDRHYSIFAGSNLAADYGNNAAAAIDAMRTANPEEALIVFDGDGKHLVALVDARWAEDTVPTPVANGAIQAARGNAERLQQQRDEARAEVERLCHGIETLLGERPKVDDEGVSIAVPWRKRLRTLVGETRDA